MTASSQNPTPPSIDPWLKLEKLAEAELRFAQADDLDELRRAMRATRAHLATLPARAPAGARSHLLRTSALRSRLEVELRRAQLRLVAQRAAQLKARKLRRRYRPNIGQGYSISV